MMQESDPCERETKIKKEKLHLLYLIVSRQSFELAPFGACKLVYILKMLKVLKFSAEFSNGRIQTEEQLTLLFKSLCNIPKVKGFVGRYGCLEI